MSKTNSGKRRILLYSQDGYGLGHLRRNLNISEQLQKRCPGIEILMIVDSPVAPFFQLPPNCDFIKLPTLVKINSGIWRPYCLSMSCRDVLDLRTQMLEEIVLKFRPHLFLVDHMPHGVLGELRKPLRALKRHRPEAKIMLGLRDILDAPQVVTHTWQKEGAFEAVEEFYDNIYIYGCKTVFATDAVYEFPQAVRSKARYCGYVAREASLERRRRNAPNPAAKDGKTVLVTGGADAGNFMELFLNAVRMLPPKIRFHAVLATGPFIGKIQKEKLQKKPSTCLCNSYPADRISSTNCIVPIWCYRWRAITPSAKSCVSKKALSSFRVQGQAQSSPCEATYFQSTAGSTPFIHKTCAQPAWRNWSRKNSIRNPDWPCCQHPI